MTLQEILKTKGVNDQNIASILDEMKQNKIFTASEENLDIRYGKLKTDHDTLSAQHKESVNLIEQMKVETQDNKILQGRISAYEAQITQLNEQLRQTKVESAVKIALLDAKANDAEYMAFKLHEKGELELDENGNIKNIDDKIAGLKTQFPEHFGGANDLKIEPLPLPDRNKRSESAVTKDEFKKMGYNSRVELKQNNPELYEQLKG